MSNVFRVELQPPPIINTVVECCEDSIQVQSSRPKTTTLAGRQ